MTTIATICARGGSAGVPGKNIRLLDGKPLIAHTIEQALKSPEINRTVVSTDSEEIAEIARDHGAEVPYLRPAELATATAAKLPVIQHLIEHLDASGARIDRIIDLDPTSPLRTLDDISTCLELLTPETNVVLTAYEAEKNPYFNMIEAQQGGGYDLVKRHDPPFVRRQDAPQVLSMNASIYVWWRHTLKGGMFGPRTQVHVMPRERSIDIDAPLDFEIVELLMERKIGR